MTLRTVPNTITKVTVSFCRLGKPVVAAGKRTKAEEECKDDKHFALELIGTEARLCELQKKKPDI